MLERQLGPEAIVDEAVEHLVADAYRAAVREQSIVPLADPAIEVVQAEAGKPVIFKATVQVPPEVTLGDYRNFNFSPEIETIDDAEGRQGHRRAARPERGADPGRGPGREGRLRGHRVPGDPRRRALRGRDHGPDAPGHRRGAADPRLRGPPRRREGRRLDRVRHHLPGRLRRADAGRQAGPLRGRPEGAPRRRSCPTPTTSSPTRWATTRRSTCCARMSRRASSATPSIGPATRSADRIIEYAVANATLELPDILVDQEVEVMHDEFRSTPRPPGDRRGRVPGGDRADRGGAARRIPAARRDAGQDAARPLRDRGPRRGRGERRGRRGRSGRSPRAVSHATPGRVAYFDSPRGRNFIRCTLRRTQTVGGPGRRVAGRPSRASPDPPRGIRPARGGAAADAPPRPTTDAATTRADTSNDEPSASAASDAPAEEPSTSDQIAEPVRPA